MEQNSRPQLLYTDEDRQLLEEAWTLTNAHREDLVGLSGISQDAPSLVDRSERPTVMDMLQSARG